MIVQSIQCDNCGKIMKIDNYDYFELSGSIKRGIKYSLNSKDENPSHICANCFIKHFNLMVSTTREPIGIENQEGVVKRMIEDTRLHVPSTLPRTPLTPYIYEKPWFDREATCLDESKATEVCAGKTCVKVPSINDPYPI